MRIEWSKPAVLDLEGLKEFIILYSLALALLRSTTYRAKAAPSLARKRWRNRGRYILKRAFILVTLFLSLIITVACTPEKVNPYNTPSVSSSQSEVKAKENAAYPTENTKIADTAEQQNIEIIKKDTEDYLERYPEFSITCNDNPITWIRGDANYIGKADVLLGNTDFGADDQVASQVLKGTVLKPSSIVELKADEVAGLDKPRYKVFLFDKSKKDNQLNPYPLTENRFVVPKKAGEYLFLCNADWGKGNNEITYWIKILITE